MKRSLSLILAALLAASALVACETTPAETQTPETNAPATDAAETNVPATDAVETEAPETDAPATTTAMITENGTAKSHIVVAEGADTMLTYAAQELATHIKLVSGAEIATVTEASTDSLAIVIATPESNPELEELFADDLAWLRDLGDGAKVRWGSDGFAIRSLENTLYIFGATPRGALNGVYDFIEDNMGVLWVRADESYGTIYDEMPTISVMKVDYREKSPFELRGWTLAGYSDAHRIQMARNKLNARAIGCNDDTESYAGLSAVGIEPFVSYHNIKTWVQNSPSYDPNCTEYWSTTKEGEHAASAAGSTQVNYWSDITVQCIADSVIAFLDRHKEGGDIDYVGINLEDTQTAQVYPEMTEPYEYSPGKFTTPDDPNYISTVFFGFINKIAMKVAEKHPDVKITSYSYSSVEAPPKSDIELCDNVYITYCSYNEDMLADMDNPDISLAYIDYQHQMDWMEITSNIQVYAYYGCVVASPLYERACWDRIQSDLQLYAANGLNGMVTEGVGDAVGVEAWAGWAERTATRAPYYTNENIHTMNTLTYWLYGKLCWNPNEDVDALIDYYCEKVYGDAAPYMREYYRLLDISWSAGAEAVLDDFQNHMKFNRTVMDYWDFFIDVEVDGVYIYDAICEALNQAWEAADEQQRKLMGHIKDVYDNAEALFVG